MSPRTEQVAICTPNCLHHGAPAACQRLGCSGALTCAQRRCRLSPLDSWTTAGLAPQLQGITSCWWGMWRRVEKDPKASILPPPNPFPGPSSSQGNRKNGRPSLPSKGAEQQKRVRLLWWPRPSLSRHGCDAC